MDKCIDCDRSPVKIGDYVTMIPNISTPAGQVPKKGQVVRINRIEFGYTGRYIFYVEGYEDFIYSHEFRLVVNEVDPSTVPAVPVDENPCQLELF